MIRRWIEKTVERLGKHGTFTLDPQLSTVDITHIVIQNAFWALRGVQKRFTFRRAKGFAMVGTGVRIRHPRYLTVGKNFIVEDYAEIMALSRQGIICGDNVTIGAYATIKPSNYYGRNMGEGLRIGNNSNIGRYSYVGCSGLITIGDNVMMGPRVSLFAENHNFDDATRLMRDQGVTREPIVIEDNCWIASGSTILAGVTVGAGSVVAAGSVVTTDVPPNSIVAGSPARPIGAREESYPHASETNPLLSPEQ